YYYNPTIDCLGELRKVLPLIAAVHLKDTTGGLRSDEFPPVGQGVVPFPELLQAMDAQGYDGPVTFEIEGRYMKGVDGRVAAFGDFLRQSVAFVRPLLAG